MGRRKILDGEKKRLIVEVKTAEHQHIKDIAHEQGMTIKKWILQAIASKIRDEINMGYVSHWIKESKKCSSK